MCWCLKLYIYIMDGVVFDIWKFYLQTQKNKTFKKTQLLKKKRETKRTFLYFLFYYLIIIGQFFFINTIRNKQIKAMNTNIFILLTFWKTLKLVEGYIKTQTNFLKICFRISTKK